MTKPATRQLLIKLHLIAAAIMFPAIAMFLVTGALYTWGITGEYVEREYPVALSAPLADDEAALVALASAELLRRDIAVPSGTARVSDGSLSWSGANRDIELSGTDNPLVATLTVKDTTLFRRLVQLHKAKGATAFKLYATLLAAALFLLVVSGLVIGLVTPSLKRLTWWTSGIGVAAFVGAVAIG